MNTLCDCIEYAAAYKEAQRMLNIAHANKLRASIPVCEVRAKQAWDTYRAKRDACPQRDKTYHY